MEERDRRPLRNPLSWLQALNSDRAQAEIFQEDKGRIVLAGRRGVGKSMLYNWLHGWEVSPTVDPDPWKAMEENLGLFTLVDLPEEDGAIEGRWPQVLWLYGHDLEMSEASLLEEELSVSVMDGRNSAEAIIFMADATRGLDRAERRWFYRLRATGRPMLVALNKIDACASDLTPLVSQLRDRLAVPVIPISAKTGANVLEGLLPQVIRLNPSLTVPLGREVPAFRQAAAMHLIRRSMLACGLLGVEPVPLLDIPFQLIQQMRLVRRLTIMYGRASEHERRIVGQEVLATLAGGLVMRYLVQQCTKLVPVFGWLASGLLSAITTWVIGRTAMTYLDRTQKGISMVDVEELITRGRNLWTRCRSGASKSPGLQRR